MKIKVEKKLKLFFIFWKVFHVKDFLGLTLSGIFGGFSLQSLFRGFHKCWAIYSFQQFQAANFGWTIPRNLIKTNPQVWNQNWTHVVKPKPTPWFHIMHSNWN